MRRMPIRAVMLLAALALAVFAVDRAADHRACQRAAVEAYALGEPGTRGLSADSVAGELLARCRGAERLTQASERLGRGGRLAPSQRLAQAAVEREPDRWLAWLALAGARERRGDLVGGERARTRVRSLNPRYPVPSPAAPPAGAVNVP